MIAFPPPPKILQFLCAYLRLGACSLCIGVFFNFNINWQERLSSKDQKISENFYVRGDGTVSSSLFYAMF
jgi:hypothetical protein